MSNALDTTHRNTIHIHITTSVALSLLICFMYGAKLVCFISFSTNVSINHCEYGAFLTQLYSYSGIQPFTFPISGRRAGYFALSTSPRNFGRALRMPPSQFTYPRYVGRLFRPNVPPACSPRPGYCQPIGIRPLNFASAWRMAPRRSVYSRCVGHRPCPIFRPHAPRWLLPPYRCPLPP